MTKYYEVRVAETSKAIGSRDPKGEGYQTFNTEEHRFSTLKQVKDFIKEKYHGHKRERMYVDMPDGSAKAYGYVYSFKNRDWSHPYNDDGTENEWYQQDWVEVREIKSTLINI